MLHKTGTKVVIDNFRQEVAASVSEQLLRGTMMKDDVMEVEIGDVSGASSRQSSRDGI